MQSWDEESKPPGMLPPQQYHVITGRKAGTTQTSRENDVVDDFCFVSSDETSPHTPGRHIYGEDQAFSPLKRSFSSPFQKIPLVNVGTTPLQLHELKKQSKPLPLNAEIGSRPGFSATPGPKIESSKANDSLMNNVRTPPQYGLFDENSRGKNLIYSSYKNSVLHPSSPDMKDMQPWNTYMLNQLVDSPDGANFKVDEDEGENRNDESDESYNRTRKHDPTVSRLFQDGPAIRLNLSSNERDFSASGPGFSSPVDSWMTSSASIEQNQIWQQHDKIQSASPPPSLSDMDGTSILGCADPDIPVPQSKDPLDLLQSSYSVRDILPKPSRDVTLSLPNSVQNKNSKWNKSRTSLDRSVTGSMESDPSLSYIQHRKMGITLDLVRISNDSSKNANKQDFVESPRSKAAFKDFNNRFRAYTKRSFLDAEEFANQEVLTMPEHAKWRVYVELAELAKKNNDADKARHYYIKACGLEKRASTTWLEWSKMEEENGRPLEALKVLKVGLGICKLNDTLLPRSIKLHERLCLHDDIREFLSNLRQDPLERTWKSILEGCMFEARIGNYSRAREVYKFLMSYVPWYGPIYFEAFRLEERDGNDLQALSIIKTGLKELPRYGPLWFGLMRIMERRDIQAEQRLWQIGEIPKLQELNHECDEAVKSISKELTWRVHYERFQAEERAAEIAALGLYEQSSSWSKLTCRRFMLSNCRKSLTQSLLLCPSNLRWKLFLVGARLELGLGDIKTARDLIHRSFQEVPSKSKANVYIECSRLEEYIGNFDVARNILNFAKDELQNDWRLCLESILLEARLGHISTAVELASEAVAMHPGTGRIWALYIQLNHRWESCADFYLSKNGHVSNLIKSLMEDNATGGNESKLDKSFYLRLMSMSPKNIIVRKAIMEVPKSGEVWCEQGRCRLNPFLLNDFDLAAAQQSFSFAIQFTPQYGDTFIEYLRLEVICQVFLKYLCEEVLHLPFHEFIVEVFNHDKESDTYLQSLQHHGSNLACFANNGSLRSVERSTRRKVMLGILQLKYDFEKKLDPSGQHELPQLLRRCVNADPNYGSAWFHCRELPYDIPTHIMGNAQRLVRLEMESCRLLYGRAVLLYIRESFEKHKESFLLQFGERFVMELMEDFRYCDHILNSQGSERARKSPNTEGIHGPLLLEVEETLFSCSDFVTGIIDLNRTIFNPHNTEELRRRYLFGIDQIVS